MSNILVGAVGLLANCIVISTLVVAISAPIARRKVRIVFFAWVAAVLYSNTSSDAVAVFLSWTRLPLIPLATCYNFGARGSIGWSGLAALLMDVGYVMGLTLLAEYWMARRDLLLQ